jgi:hypothetical protein
MSAWDKTNTRPHVRSAVGAGFQFCFIGGGQSESQPSHAFGPSTRPPLGAPLDEVNTEFMDVPF